MRALWSVVLLVSLCGCWTMQATGESCPVLEFADPEVMGDFTDAVNLAFADADLDGDLDVFVMESSQITLLENTGTPTSEWTGTTVGSGTWGSGIFARDVNGDGFPDAIAALQAEAGVGWWENPGGDGEWEVHQVSGDYNTYWLEGVEDVDGDGRVDFLVECITYIIDDGWSEFSDFIVFKNAKVPSDTWSEIPLASDVRATTGDINDDGRVDIVVIFRLTEELCWFENDALPVDDWKLHPIAAPHEILGNIWPMDFDGDGDLDVAYRSLGSILSAWLNTDGVGETWLPAPGQIDAGDDFVSLATGDLDLDGDDDVVFIVDTNPGPGPAEYLLRVMRNGWMGEETWLDLSEAGFFDSSLSPRPFVVDLDSDGDRDLVVASPKRGVYFWENLCVL